MKTIRYIILAFSVVLLLVSFNNCGEKGEDDPEPTQKEIKTGFLINKTNGWSLKSITVPLTSATTEDQWVDFKLSVSTSTMSTSGHATGATAVWPTGAWIMDENGNTITRGDGVVMSILTLTATGFRVSFAVPEGTEINGRIASLDGDYIFDLE